MKVTTITASYQRVFNLGNYESLRLECTLEATLDEADLEDLDGASGAEVCANELFEQAKAIVKTQAMPVLKKRSDDTATVRNGLPADVQSTLEN